MTNPSDFLGNLSPMHSVTRNAPKHLIKEALNEHCVPWSTWVTVPLAPPGSKLRAETHIHESLKVLMSHTFGPFVHNWRIRSSAHAAWWSVAQPLSNWPFHFHSKHKNCSEISPGVLTLPGWLHTPSRELVSFKSSMHCTQNWCIFPDQAHAGETEKSLQILHPHTQINTSHIQHTHNMSPNSKRHTYTQLISLLQPCLSCTQNWQVSSDLANTYTNLTVTHLLKYVQKQNSHLLKFCLCMFT